MHSEIKPPFKILLPKEESLLIYLSDKCPTFEQGVRSLISLKFEHTLGGSQNFLTKNIELF